MKLWEKFLTVISKPFLSSLLNFSKKYVFENFLQHAFTLLNDDISEEIKRYVKSQTSEFGAFKDKAGNPDLYYSVFGHFISKAIRIPNIGDGLRRYIKNEDYDSSKSVNIFCKSILYSQLFKKDSHSLELRDKVLEIINDSSGKKKEYNWFLGFLALYYHGEYYALNKLLKELKTNISEDQENTSITLLAVNTILLKFSGKNVNSHTKQLMKYYRSSGGFAAFQNAPFEDLLSTAVALYTLCVCGEDLRLIKPQTLEYVTSLYDNGGFCATELDPDIDIEYTFYGLLALASLAYENK